MRSRRPGAYALTRRRVPAAPQHGNLAKVLGSTQFAPYLSVDHDVIRWHDVGSLRGVIPEEVAERASALDAEIASRRAGK